jgi:hypothetical protein
MDKISGLQGQLTNQISQIQNSEGLSGLKNQFSQIKEMTKQVIKEATIASEENNEDEDEDEDGYDSDEEGDQEQEERKQRLKLESGWGIKEEEEEADSDNSFVGEGKERGEQFPSTASSSSSSSSASHHPTSRLLYEENSEVYDDRKVFGEEEEELSFSSSLSPFGSPVKKGKPSASPSKAVLHNKASREHLNQLQDNLNASTLQNEKLRASVQEKEVCSIHSSLTLLLTSQLLSGTHSLTASPSPSHLNFHRMRSLKKDESLPICKNVTLNSESRQERQWINNDGEVVTLRLIFRM